MRVQNQSPLLRASLAALVLTALNGCATFSRLPDSMAIAAHDDEPLTEPEWYVADSKASDRPARVAGPLSRGIISEPKPFAWKAKGESAGRRDIEVATVGNQGYRTLVIGSLAGDDPLAISLTEQLAEHVHSNSIILGGVEATFIRNANPDGAAKQQTVNAKGVYLNRAFPAKKQLSADFKTLQPEVRFVLGHLNDHMPQRIIHIRTCKERRGLIASNAGAESAAKDVAKWLDFEFLPLPGNSSVGTLERYVSSQQSCDIITIAFPETTSEAELWERFRDPVLNLLLDEDYETRKLARTKRNRASANRKSNKNAEK